MTLQPGTEAYGAALDRHITGNWGHDYGMGKPTEESFQEWAEDQLWDTAEGYVRSLVMGEITWESFIHEAGLDPEGAQKAVNQFHHPPTTEEGKEVVAAIKEATAAMMKVMKIIGLDEYHLAETARDLEDAFDDGEEGPWL